MNSKYEKKIVIFILFIGSLFSRSIFSQEPQKITYYSQFDQDKYLNEHYFKDKIGGVFIDIGAHDGIKFSNTLFFEKYLGWKGICIEPMPDIFQELIRNRTCTCINGCIANFNGTARFLKITSPYLGAHMLSGIIEKYVPAHMERIMKELAQYGGSSEVIDVHCYALMDVVKDNNIFYIDYMSIDTEGGEFEILQSIDFSLLQIDIIDVENNYEDNRIRDFLEAQGYEYITRLEVDEIYKKKVKTETVVTASAD